VTSFTRSHIDGSPVLQPLEASRDYVFAAAGIPQDLFRSN
jgi:hypothetical protein